MVTEVIFVLTKISAHSGIVGNWWYETILDNNLSRGFVLLFLCVET